MLAYTLTGFVYEIQDKYQQQWWNIKLQSNEQCHARLESDLYQHITRTSYHINRKYEQARGGFGSYG